MTVEELVKTGALVGASSTIAGAVGSKIGYARGLVRGLLDHRHHVDRDSIFKASLHLYHDEEWGDVFEIQTDGGILSLASVFGDRRLETHIGGRVGNVEVGEPLMKDGDDHYLAMGRVYAYVTRGSSTATQSSMFERFDEVRRDMTAVYLTVAVGDDGQKIPYILTASAKHLMHLEQMLAGRISFRDAHDRFVPVLRRMAAEFKNAQELYDLPRSGLTEQSAGKYANVWLAPVRTPVVLTKADVREAAREVFLEVLAQELPKYLPLR